MKMNLKRVVLVASVMVTLAVIFPKGLKTRAADFSVVNFTELQNAVDNASSGNIIELLADIQIPDSTSLVITPGKNVVLVSDTGTRKLIGSSMQHTITVREDAELKIDGITVTHNGTNIGTGVFLFTRAKFHFISGEISNNRNSQYTQQHGAGVYMGTNAIFIMDGGVIKDNIARTSGGGVYSQGTFILNGGEIYNNQANAYGVWGTTVYPGEGGGGIYALSSFEMNGGSIYNNTAPMGGGLFIVGNTIITGGHIYGNNALNDGGGIAIWDLFASVVEISNASITDNKAKNHGGGIFIYQDPNDIYQRTITLTDVLVNDNSVSGSGGMGGGLYLISSTKAIIKGESAFCGNTASLGNGGAIYTNDAGYANLKIGVSTIFLNNEAATAYEAPIGAVASYPDISYKSTSISTHPLNNDDINYSGSATAQAVIYYNANGGTGEYVSSPVTSGSTVQLLDESNTYITKEEYQLIGWSNKDVCCTLESNYALGENITLDRNIILYAKWLAKQPEVSYSLIYNANKGVGGLVVAGIDAGNALTILTDSDADVVYPGYTFVHWNTEPNDSGSIYLPGDSIIIDDDTELFAIWQLNSSGPNTSDETLAGLGIILLIISGGSFVILRKKKAK